MSCSIISDDIHILLKEMGQNAGSGGSALQNPDISRMTLASMLRRKKQDSTRGYWAAFMASHMTKVANMNG